MSVFAIVPVKKLDEAKTRLSSLLSNNERREFCLKMLEDVLVTVKTTRCIRRTVVVSVDPTVLQVAKRFGVVPLMESQPGLNQAVSEAINWCVQNEAKSTLILPADIPSVTPRDLNKIFSLGKEATMVISPSRSEDGTNALLLTPPKTLPTFYGKHSFQRYITEASKRAISFHTIKLPRIALDIDTVEDLADFVKLNTKETNTHKFLMKTGISQRLSKW
jgi:2-phospho-L-lactate guanylyltransferase